MRWLRRCFLSCLSHNLITKFKLKPTNQYTMPAKKNQDVAEKAGKQNHAKNEKGGTKPGAAGKNEKKAEKPS
jgi:prophage tail gpP-like protein